MGGAPDRGRGAPADKGLTFSLPIRTRSVLNLREHWAARHRRSKAQRDAVRLLWPRAWKAHTWGFPVVVHLVRLKPSGRPLDAEDNLPAAFKAIRDEVAAQLGVDDGDRKRIRWTYDEERGPWGVRIEVTEATR